MFVCLLLVCLLLVCLLVCLLIGWLQLMGYAVVRVAAQGFVWLQSSTPRVSDSERLGLDDKRNMSEKILEDFGVQCASVRLCYEVLIGCIEEAMAVADARQAVAIRTDERMKGRQAQAMAELLSEMRHDKETETETEKETEREMETEMEIERSAGLLEEEIDSNGSTSTATTATTTTATATTTGDHDGHKGPAPPPVVVVVGSAGAEEEEEEKQK